MSGSDDEGCILNLNLQKIFKWRTALNYILDGMHGAQSFGSLVGRPALSEAIPLALVDTNEHLLRPGLVVNLVT